MAMFWATSYPIGVWLSDYKAPEAIVVTRVFTAFVFLVVLAKITQTKIFPFNKKIVLQLVALGFFGFVVHNYLMFIGLQYTTATKGALINGAIPIVVMTLDFLFYRKIMHSGMLFGATISFFGVLLVITEGKFDQLLDFGIGVGEISFLVAIIGWGFYSIVARPLLERNEALWVTALPCLFGGVFLVPLMGLNFENSLLMLTNQNVVIVLIIQGILTMGLGFLWYYEGIKKLGTASASMYLNLVPVFGTALSYFFLKEQLNGVILTGGILTIAGVFWVNWCRSGNPNL